MQQLLKTAKFCPSQHAQGSFAQLLQPARVKAKSRPLRTASPFINSLGGGGVCVCVGRGGVGGLGTGLLHQCHKLNEAGVQGG